MPGRARDADRGCRWLSAGPRRRRMAAHRDAIPGCARRDVSASTAPGSPARRPRIGRGWTRGNSEASDSKDRVPSNFHERFPTPVKLSPEVDDLARRLAADYRPRLAEMGAELGVWANSTQIGVEIPAGKLGPRWAKKVRYAHRFVLVGKTLPLKTAGEAEIELRG